MAAGQEVTTRPSLRPLADLAITWDEDGARPQWTRLRAWVDAATRLPTPVMVAAIAARPPASASPVLDTLLAAIAEKVTDDRGVARPAWTDDVAALPVEWSEPATPRLREAWREHTPRQLRARGLVVDEATLWRRTDERAAV